jgi:hypothetical protein
MGAKALKMPNARVLTGPGAKAWPRRALALGSRAAGPRPARARATIKGMGEVTTLETMDQMVSQAYPAVKRVFLP